MYRAFDACLTVEEQGLEILAPIVPEFYNQYVLIGGDSDLTVWIQENVGDMVARNPPSAPEIVDFKIEEFNKHKNFFLEMFSNKSRRTLGWFVTARYTKLWYFFLDTRQLFIIDFDSLKRWGRGPSKKGRRCRLIDFPLREQDKRKQMNDTWGRCVPIDVIREEVGFDDEGIV